MNTFNRLIAGAFRLALEPKAASFVTDSQQGFVTGRSMLANIIEVDDSCHQMYHDHHNAAAAVFFDFEAAFPSISQGFMWEVLEGFGMPVSWVKAISFLYADNYQQLKLGGQVLPGFSATSGVRQGCPLSPLLFALASDLLLRRIERHFPDCMLRAYADDTVMVLPHFRQLEQILQLFQEFASISGLKLNLKKTVLVPLGTDQRHYRSFLQKLCPDIEVAAAAKYLGMYLGPGAPDANWREQEKKYSARCRLWSSPRIGNYQASKCYRIFCFSVLCFAMQFLHITPSLRTLETKYLNVFVPSPGNSFLKGDLFTMGLWYDFPCFFPSMELTAEACKLRVFKDLQHTINFEDRSTELNFAGLGYPEDHAHY